jgi:hypothetical protein
MDEKTRTTIMIKRWLTGAVGVLWSVDRHCLWVPNPPKAALVGICLRRIHPNLFLVVFPDLSPRSYSQRLLGRYPKRVTDGSHQSHKWREKRKRGTSHVDTIQCGALRGEPELRHDQVIELVFILLIVFFSWRLRRVRPQRIEIHHHFHFHGGPLARGGA